jgi:hypothetical protein
MKLLIQAAIVIALAGAIPVHAQDSASVDPPSIVRLSTAEAFEPADSIAPQPKRSLLPQSMSFVERGLWGEEGLVRSLGIASPLTPDVRKHELDVRRTMLTAHQIGGFVTLGLMLGTVYAGQQYLNSNTRSYRNLHETLIPFTIGAYSATGALAILSPPPMIRRDEISTTTIHKTLAWVHAIGMILTPIIGASLHHSMNYDQLARFHQISAYITTAAFAASMITVTF